MFILNYQKLETQMFFNRKLDKQTLVYSHDEILHNIKKKQTIDTGNNMDRSQQNYAGWKKPVPKDSIYVTILK